MLEFFWDLELFMGSEMSLLDFSVGFDVICSYASIRKHLFVYFFLVIYILYVAC